MAAVASGLDGNGLDGNGLDGNGLGAGLPPLLVAATRVAATVAQGVHGRRRTGVGDSFWQFRPYRSGDELRAIDWRLSARSQHVLVREREWEAAQSVWHWIDRSPSMAWRSHPHLPLKGERAALLALALTALLIRAGERTAVIGLDAHAQGGRLQLARIADHFTRPPAAAAQASLPPATAMPRHARFVLFSDLMAADAEIEQMIVSFAAQGVTGHLLRILDPAEADFPYQGRTRFAGLEGEGEVLLGRAETLGAAYRRRLAAQRDSIAGAARRSGWTVIEHRTDQPPEQALLALYQALTTEGAV